MPPRRAKKGGSAKKPSSTPKVEEPQVVEEEAPSSAIVEAPATKVVEESGNNQESVTFKEEISVTTTTTVVVEERKFEIEASGVGQDVVMENKSESTGLLEEKKPVEEDVVMDGNGDAPDGEEMEEEGGEEEEEEEGEDGEESEPEEDVMQDVVEGEEAAVEATVGGGDGDNEGGDGDNEGGDNEGEESESGTDEDDEEDVELSSYMQNRDKKKQSGVEIFVGGLNRKAVEDDLTKVFGEFGEIKSVRIVKHPVTKRSKGYAFLSYSTVEQAQKVLTDLKDGIEVLGKRAGVSASQDSDTLYMGNICKSWNKEKVLETLKGFGIEQIDEIFLPEDPKSEGMIRGYAYLEFVNHSDAMSAFQRLRKPDAVFGRNRSAKVAFAPSMHPSAEALSQVKTIYVEGLTDSWDEEKLKKLCEQYGEVEKVQLSRDLVTVKRKDFGFVTFTERDNAVTCVGAINNAEIGEGDIKVKANLAKPQYKGRLGKNARGGYKVPKEGEEAKEGGKSKRKEGNRGKGRGDRKPRGRDVVSKRKEEAGKGRKRDGRSSNVTTPSERPSKKPRDNGGRGRSSSGRAMNGGRGRSSSSYGGGRGGRQGRGYHTAAAPVVYADPYARGGYGAAPSRSSYQGGHASYGGVSDMEPHAGYLHSAAPADPYDYRLRRAGGYDTQRSRATSYGGGSMLPPPSYAPEYSRYPPAYESGGAGGYTYPSSGTYVPRRQYC